MSAIIIFCAITGSIHTPSMSPNLSATTAEGVASAIGAAEAGAPIPQLGVKDGLSIDRGALGISIARQVTGIRGTAEALGRTVESPDAARGLGPERRGKVAF